MPASRRRRAFGQHFLRDASVIQKIVDAAREAVQNAEARTLLEIGPGKGALTHGLLTILRDRPNLENFIIVEKDSRLAESWYDTLRAHPNTRIFETDFLELDEKNYLRSDPVVVVSNLPYSAGTAILQKLAEFRHQIPKMILMFQAEVAARLRAHPGEKAWGSLSLWIQNEWDVRRFLSVPPGAFAPPPEVHSEVVILEARAEPRISAPPEATLMEILSWKNHWEKLIRLPFLHRRKMLRSALPKNSVWQIAMAEAGIDGTRRGEDLEWTDWRAWMREVHRLTFEFNQK